MPATLNREANPSKGRMKFHDSPKGETRGMLDKLVVKLMVLKMWLSDDHGQDIMEYALLGGFIALAAAAAFVLLPIGSYMNAFAGTIGNCVNLGAANYACP